MNHTKTSNTHIHTERRKKSVFSMSQLSAYICGFTNGIYFLSKDLFVRLKARHIPHTHAHNLPENKKIICHIMSFCLAVCCYKRMNNAVCLSYIAFIRNLIIWRKVNFEMPIYRLANRTLMSANLDIGRWYLGVTTLGRKYLSCYCHYVPFDLIYIFDYNTLVSTQ